MIVCVCHRVSERDIHAAAGRGVASFDALQRALRVGTGCGSCLDCARDAWADAHACAGAMPQAAPGQGAAVAQAA